jgi:uncharacterized protein (TIGR00369 family)
LAFTARFRGFEAKVRESFARQQFMATIGAELVHVAPGEVDVELSPDPRLTQQHGFLHAGVVVAAVDSACGYAALSLMDEASDVLTVELKVNLLAPATGQRLLARGRVLRSGRTLTVCSGEAVAVAEGAETVVATLLTTMMAVPGSPSERITA